MNNMMQITSIPQVSHIQETQNNLLQNKANQTGFATALKNALEHVNQTGKIADEKTKALAMGKKIDLHDVVIDAQKAKITVETAVQMQQKVIDIYNEVMRMQI